LFLYADSIWREWFEDNSGSRKTDEPEEEGGLEMKVLEVENVSKSFRGDMSFSSREVLHGVSFYAENGEILGFLGPNGAGKTTTIKIILGMLKSDSGVVRIYGKSTEDTSMRSRIGYLPENPYLFPHLTLREFLELCGNLTDLHGDYLSYKIKNVMSLLDLEKYGDLRLKNFSKGMTQKAALAQAILHEPDLIVLDEPFSGLDPVGRKKMKDILVELKNEGKTIFFSSHILSDMEALCDRTYIIRDGSIVRCVDVSQLHMMGSGMVEVTVSGISKENLEGIFEYVSSVNEIGDELVVVVDRQEHLRQVINHLYSAGADIKRVENQHMSLEEIFLEEVKSDINSRRKDSKEKVTV